MDGIRIWIERLRGVLFKSRVERELEEEMQPLFSTPVCPGAIRLPTLTAFRRCSNS